MSMEIKTKAVGIRVPTILLEKIDGRAGRRKISRNRWVNCMIIQSLRSHHKVK